MSQRKLQQEMDRVFKRINEGLEIFNTLYDRHQSSSNASQKEKLENDLKKEIKKLQRFREQVKNWQATNEVKDKDKLNEHRRLVETAMEQYKIVEKGSKTKAYSDESLANSHLTSFQRPEDEEKYGLLQFVQHALDEIQRFQEMTESELDKLLLTSKKSKRGNSYANEEKKSELEEMLAIHKFHQEKLEIILRLLENDILSVDEVIKIQDDVKYYLEENQNPDFINDDTIYDDLNLDSEESVILELQNSLNNANIANGEDGSSASVVLPTTSSSVASPSPSSSSPIAAPAQNTPQKLKTIKERSMSPQPQSTNAIDSQGGLPPISSITGGSMTTLKPATAPVKPAELKWSVAAAASISNNNSSNNGNSSSHNSNDQISGNSTTSPSPLQNQTSSESQLSTVQQISAPPGISTSSEPKLVNTNALNAASVLEALKKQKNQDESFDGSTIEGQQQQDQEPGQEIPIAQSDIERELAQNESEIDNDVNFKYLPPGIQSTILSFVASRNRSLTPENTSYQLSNISTMLSIPRYFSPLSSDIAPPGLEAQRVSTIWNSIRSSTNLEIDAQNLDSSTLFYAYYFGLSKDERNISESILVNRRWQLNKANRLTWYQRHSQVKHTGEDFEIADYNIFDANNWSISEKKNFRVEFKQLL